MCGRFTRDMSWADVHAFSRGLDLLVPESEPEPSWNVCPTDPSWVIAAEAAGGVAKQMRWGLLPPWAKDAKIGASMINARLETVATKPAFRNAWRARHCLVPATGYYEWRLEHGIKQPYWIHDLDHRILMFAALWENWKSPAGDWVQSFAIITRDAVEPLSQLHDRMPLMLAAPALADWLHAHADVAAAIADAAAPPNLVWHPVDRAVANPRSEGRRLIDPVALPPAPEPGSSASATLFD